MLQNEDDGVNFSSGARILALIIRNFNGEGFGKSGYVWSNKPTSVPRGSLGGDKETSHCPGPTDCRSRNKFTIVTKLQSKEIIWKPQRQESWPLTRPTPLWTCRKGWTENRALKRLRIESSCRRSRVDEGEHEHSDGRYHH